MMYSMKSTNLKQNNVFIFLLILGIFCGISGCEERKPVSSMSPSDIGDCVKSLNKDDKLKVYYLLSGIAMYVENYEGVETTTQAIKLFRNVRDRLKVNRDGMHSLDDLIEKRLLQNEFDVPKKMSDKAKLKICDDSDNGKCQIKELDTTNREEFVKIFKEFAEGAKNAIK